jgi:IrrE N-terminal-like domain
MSLCIDRSVFADLGQPAAIARALLGQVPSLSIPVPIEDLAVACGITSIDEVDVQSFEGALIAPDHKDTGQILVRSSIGTERRRFTVGHELGHFLNIWHVPPSGRFECTPQDMRGDDNASPPGRPKWEAEANAFAIEVLIPRAPFVSRLRLIKEPGLEHIVELAGSFQMSKLATARRFREFAEEPCAILQSKDQTVRCFYRHALFPFLAVRHGQEVHRKSVTATFQGSPGECSDMRETEASYWIESERSRGLQMYEQVLCQQEGYRLTLLSIETNPDEVEDDEEDPVRDRSTWRPTFRR